MLTFKEFVFKTWELRADMGAPVGEQAEESFLLWNDEHPNNGWWRRYKTEEKYIYGGSFINMYEAILCRQKLEKKGGV